MEIESLLNLDVGVLLMASISVVTEVCKRFNLPAKYLPLVAVVLGIGGGLLLISVTVKAAIVGLLLGAATAGLYDATKAFK